ncbi:MAG TPA: ribulose-phosphate 3-epimerase [Cyclobacteriaceae bacterium]|nr:ribulose-phosphate 3-epimerase [Cyclobacteriaceae bacterium]
MNLPIVAPSILASDFANLQKEITMINDSSADWIHVDIMDGVFVPNISMGLPVVHAVKKHARKPLDVHLMIVQPERYIEAFRDAGASVISVHVEACTHLHRTIEQIKASGAQAGVALNPHTPVSSLSEVISDIDLVCLMSVNPGFGGQKFIQNTYNKIQELSAMIAKKNAKVLIEIDGGVNEENAKSLIEAGASVLVAGNFVFTSPDPKKTIAKLKSV